MAKSMGACFFDAQTIIETCDENGIHINAENHIKLGTAVASLVKEILE